MLLGGDPLLKKDDCEKIRIEVLTQIAPSRHGVVHLSDLVRLYSPYFNTNELEECMNHWKRAKKKDDADGLSYVFPEFPRGELRRIKVDLDNVKENIKNKEKEIGLLEQTKEMWLSTLDWPSTLDEKQLSSLCQYVSIYWDEKLRCCADELKVLSYTEQKLEVEVLELKKVLEDPFEE